MRKTAKDIRGAVIALALASSNFSSAGLVSSGTVNLNPASGDNLIGNITVGSLTINGGHIEDQSDSNTAVGFSGSTGELTVTGAGSKYIVGGIAGNLLTVGGRFGQPGGSGTINVLNGGKLQVDSYQGAGFTGGRIILANGNNYLNL